MGFLAGSAIGRIRRCHAYALADGAGIFGRRGQRFLKGNALVAKGELHRLTRAAVGNGKHAGIALAHDLLDARHKTVVRACDGRLLNLELGRHRAAGTNEAYVVQALLGTKIELLSAHVQTVQAVNPRLAGGPRYPRRHAGSRRTASAARTKPQAPCHSRVPTGSRSGRTSPAKSGRARA